MRVEVTAVGHGRIKSGPLPKLSPGALQPENLETRALPRVVLTAFVLLLVIQLFLLL